MDEAAVGRRAGRPFGPAGGKELFLGSSARGGCGGSNGGGGGSADASGKDPVIGDASDKPDKPDVGVRRLELTTGTVPV